MGFLVPSDHLTQILRWSLSAAAEHDDNSIAIAEDGFGNGSKNPATRKLIEQILFTRRFVPTYYVALGLILLAFTSVHWCSKYTKWRRRTHTHGGRKRVQNTSPTASSSSSTLQDMSSASGGTSPKLEANERTHLLAQPTLTSSSIFRRVHHRVDAFLAYQPAPVSALTSSSNQLPPNGTSIAILVFFGINIFYLFYHTPISIPMLFAFADRAGLLFVANLPALYILAAKTNQPIKFLTGWSYEGLNIFHRRLGEWMIVLATLHTAGMFGVWYTLLRPLHFTLLRFLGTRLVLLGIFALLSYLAIYITSLGYFRQLYYETFLGLHILLQVAALVLLFFHHHNARPYVLAALGIWVFDRLISRMLISLKRFVATLEVAEDGETVLLFCDIRLKRAILNSRLSISNGWKPGQHVFVTIPGLGWQHRLQAHPFTIASPAPPSTLTSGDWPLQLIIRAQTGFSRDLLEFAKYHQHTEILLDGPYGSLDALEALEFADRSCLVAGGSGIAVTYPLAWDLLVGDDPGALVSTRTTYQNGKKYTATLLPTNMSALGDQAMHLWVKSFDSHGRWITMLPMSARLKSRLPGITSKRNGLPGRIEVADLITQLPSTRESSTKDRPDIGLELRQWVQGGGTQNRRENICVVVSGPDSLVRDVRNASADLLAQGWKIEVFVEKFGW